MPKARSGYTRGYRVLTVKEAEASKAVLQLAQYNTLKYYQWCESSGSPLPVLLPDINDSAADWVAAINEIQQVLVQEDIANGRVRVSINGIQRYDPAAGVPLRSDTYNPDNFLLRTK